MQRNIPSIVYCTVILELEKKPLTPKYIVPGLDHANANNNKTIMRREQREKLVQTFVFCLDLQILQYMDLQILQYSLTRNYCYLNTKGLLGFRLV